MFDLEQIKSQTSLAQIDFHHQLGSTNDRAIELIGLGSLSTPALILTENQTAGRGQRSNKWWSSEGSLTFSYVCPVESNSFNPVTIALAVAESIESVAKLSQLKIKWPNDILFENRKIAGILTETVAIQPQSLVVIGIGINVNNGLISDEDLEKLEADSHNQDRLRASSIKIESGQEVSQSDLLVEIINRIEHDPRSAKQVTQKINKRLAYLDETIQVKSSSGDFVGTCQAISESGHLVVRRRDGTEKKIFSGSIKAV